MLESMLSGTKWSLRPWKKTLEDQLNSWVRFIPGMGDSGELKKLGNFKELLDGFTEAELDNPDLVDSAARERIALKSGKDPAEVTRLMTFYKQSLVVQQWLALKKSLGETLPSSEAELQRMQENDIRLRSIGNKV
ncbi:hypothetical protein B484DRAFT_425105 [Ochromonadaceae sp. CCMP2298]|nr:hypothetical protein B484DRAFT_425105 [Ochromonadaceae sp. CCMP2298]